jgi:hypothetical protein
MMPSYRSVISQFKIFSVELTECLATAFAADLASAAIFSSLAY